MMCTREETRLEIERALKKNNETRDAQFDNKLSKNNQKIFEHINKVVAHNTTAPDTKREIEALKKGCNTRDTTTALIKQKMEDIEEKVNSIEKKLDDLIEKLDERHASKWTENAMIWLFMLVGGLVVTAIVTNVLK